MTEQRNEDYRITRAREILAETRPARADNTRSYDAADRAGALAMAVEFLLEVVDERAERDRLLEEAARKPLDDLMATVAEIEAERAEQDDHDTVADDIKATGDNSPVETVASLDGRERPASQPPSPARPATGVELAATVATVQRSLDVKTEELERLTRLEVAAVEIHDGVTELRDGVDEIRRTLLAAAADIRGEQSGMLAPDAVDTYKAMLDEQG